MRLLAGGVGLVVSGIEPFGFISKVAAGWFSEGTDTERSEKNGTEDTESEGSVLDEGRASRIGSAIGAAVLR